MPEQTYSIVSETYCDGDDEHHLCVLIQFDCDPEKMKDLEYKDLLRAVKSIKPRIPNQPCPVCGSEINDFALVEDWDEYAGYELIDNNQRWKTPGGVFDLTAFEYSPVVYVPE